MTASYWTALLPLLSFAFVMSITPGPNNIMLLSSGARFGLRRSLPHMLGVTGGFLALLALTAAGVGALLLSFPMVSVLLAIGCAAYLLWLAWQLVRSSGVAANKPNATEPPTASERPLSWFAAAVFQVANPKAWAMAVPMVGLTHSLEGSLASRALTTSAAVVAVNLPCIALWTVCGVVLRELLAHRWIGRALYWFMALLVAGTAVWMLAPLWRSE
jgi:threonine/homoserine/homoserine lactone efflux protein